MLFVFLKIGAAENRHLFVFFIFALQQFHIFSVLDFRFDTGIWQKGESFSVRPKPEVDGSPCDLLLRIFAEMFDIFGAAGTDLLLTLCPWRRSDDSSAQKETVAGQLLLVNQFTN